MSSEIKIYISHTPLTIAIAEERDTAIDSVLKADINVDNYDVLSTGRKVVWWAISSDYKSTIESLKSQIKGLSFSLETTQ